MTKQEDEGARNSVVEDNNGRDGNDDSDSERTAKIDQPLECQRQCQRPAQLRSRVVGVRAAGEDIPDDGLYNT